jgi:hypothetical protein
MFHLRLAGAGILCSAGFWGSTRLASLQIGCPPLRQNIENVQRGRASLECHFPRVTSAFLHT